MLISEGNRYRNRGGEDIAIVRAIPPQHPDYGNGFRYLDSDNRTYRPDGTWGCYQGQDTDHDLIDQIGVEILLGRTYLNRLHEIITITGEIPSWNDEFRQGFRFFDHHGQRYRRNGTMRDDGSPDDRDLVERYITPLHEGFALEVGRYYINREDNILKIVAPIKPSDPLYRQGFRFQDAIGRAYLLNGAYRADGIETPKDLIEERKRS